MTLKVGDRVIVNYSNNKPIVGIITRLYLSYASVQLVNNNMVINNLPILSLKRY
jgi:primosomal protein N'